MSDYDELKKLAQMADERGDKDTALTAMKKMEELQSSGIATRAQQAAGGITEGVVRTVGAFTGDLANNVANLVRAGVGTAMVASGRTDLAPDIVEAKDAPFTGDWFVNKMPKSFLGPRTGDTTEKYIRKAGEFAGGSLLGPGAGTGMRMAVGGVSGLSSQAAADMYPESQVAPLIGALAPTVVGVGSAAMMRGALRGGPSKAREMQNAIAQQEAIGVPPDAALANERLGGVVKYLGRAPFSVKPVATKGQQVQAALKETMDDLTQAAGEPTRIGVNIGKSIDNFASTASAKWQRIDDSLNKIVPKGTGVTLVSTKDALDKLTAKISDPAFANAFENPKMLESLRAAVAGKSTVDFKTANEIRRIVGQKANDAALISDVSKGQWKALYGALKNDIGSSLKQGSREADLFNRSNKYWSAVHSRVDDIYGPIAGLGTPEAKYFKSISALNRGATQLSAIRKIMPKDEFAKVRDTFVRDLGKATPGKQNELGDLFSSERFLTNWNSLSTAGKSAIVGDNTELRRNLNMIAKQASEIRRMENIYANPSGTGMAAGSIATGGLAVGGVLQRNWSLVASVLGAMGVNNISARALTNPKFAKFLAASTTVRPDRMPAIVNRFQIELNKDEQLRNDILEQ